MSIAIIYARSLNHCIGKDGHIPWRLPNDFKHFKNTTMGCPVIMGRKTYEDHRCAFPGRLNIVVSRQEDYEAVENVYVVKTLEAALEMAQKDHDKVFIIGGVSFFEKGYELANDVYETVVNTELDGDTFLPEFDYTGWKTELMSEQAVDEKHAFSFKVLHHSR